MDVGVGRGPTVSGIGDPRSVASNSGGAGAALSHGSHGKRGAGGWERAKREEGSVCPWSVLA